MLWLSVHLPHLPLEVFTRGLVLSGPAVVAEGGQRRRVWVANRAAEKRGVEAGMALAAAQALVRELRIFPRDVRREAEALTALATWAGQWTSQVSLEADGLLLEIGGSLRLFGGAQRLMEKVRRGARALGYHALTLIAPTPLGALWLTRAGKTGVITEGAQLAQSLANLPVTVADAARAHAEALAAMGIVTLGDCAALPRAGLARRFGEALLDELDRAFGHAPDPRRFFAPPARFSSRLELPAEVHDSGALLFAARRLIHELEGFLRARDAGVERFHLDLFHADSPATRVEVGLMAASRDAQRLLALLRERLAGVSLPQPVRELVLVAERLMPYRAPNLELFPDGREAGEGIAALIERLRARLGRGRVHGLECVADHRPERAMATGEPGTAREHAMPCRPLWLLTQPRPLPCRHGVPHLGGPLRVRAGPERIESGWWDEQPIARDYFLAETAGGSRYWIYREATGQWFLHGIFA